MGQIVTIRVPLPVRPEIVMWVGDGGHTLYVDRSVDRARTTEARLFSDSPHIVSLPLDVMLPVDGPLAIPLTVIGEGVLTITATHPLNQYATGRVTLAARDGILVLPGG